MNNKITKEELEQGIQDIFKEYDEAIDKICHIYKLFYIFGNHIDRGVSDATQKQEMIEAYLEAKFELVSALFARIPTGIILEKSNLPGNAKAVEAIMTDKKHEEWQLRIKQIMLQINTNSIKNLDLEMIHSDITHKFQAIADDISMLHHIFNPIVQEINEKTKAIRDGANNR